MEGWQKGADAVLKLSGAGKERYFQNFPERKEWFQTNYPEHFGRSVAAATTSLKKVTKAKQQKQRLAAIRQAAEKRNQSAVLTPERRLMAQRRRESGEGLAGGMDTVADIRKTIAAGMPVRSGGIGSLFEKMDPLLNESIPGLSVEKKADGYYVGNQGPFKTKAEAESVSKSAEPPKPAAAVANVATDVANYFSGILDDPTAWAQGKGLVGRDWKKPGDPEESKRWGKVLGQVDASGKEIGWMSQGDQKDIIMTPPADAAQIKNGKRINDTRDPSRRPVETVAQPAGYYYRENMEVENMSKNQVAKELVEKFLEQKRLQECSPMAYESGSSEANEEPGEYDYEGDMAKSQLRSIVHNSKILHDMLDDNTNLPEWVQSKLTLAEDYILTATNYMRSEMENMSGGDVELDEASYSAKAARAGKDIGKPGKMFSKIAAAAAERYGSEEAGKRVAGAVLAKLRKEEVEQIEEGMGAAKTKQVVNPMDDLVKKSMLPDKSVIPPGKGFGDDLKKQKIKQKVGKAILKKRMARPTDNPSENEMIPKSMLPDVPGYPEGYKFEEQVEQPIEQPIEQKVEQNVETPVVEENTNSFVSAGSRFLTRTSTRLVYGDKND